MSSTTESTFFPAMISLDAIESWTVLNVLKQVREAGYKGDPSKPILFYRRALWKKMESNKGRGGGIARNVYLKAKEAYNASKYDQDLLTFVLGSMAPDTSAPITALAPAAVVSTATVTTSSVSHRKRHQAPSASAPKVPTTTAAAATTSSSTSRKLQPVASKPKKTIPAYRPAPYSPPRRSIIKGFISKQPEESPKNPSSLGPRPSAKGTGSATTKRKRAEVAEYEQEQEEHLAKVVNRHGWLWK